MPRHRNSDGLRFPRGAMLGDDQGNVVGAGVVTRERRESTGQELQLEWRSLTSAVGTTSPTGSVRGYGCGGGI